MFSIFCTDKHENTFPALQSLQSISKMDTTNENYSTRSPLANTYMPDIRQSNMSEDNDEHRTCIKICRIKPANQGKRG